MPLLTTRACPVYGADNKEITKEGKAEIAKGIAANNASVMRHLGGLRLVSFRKYFKVQQTHTGGRPAPSAAVIDRVSNL